MSKNHYKLRFFFDAGSGACFWSGNDSAEHLFGDYAIANSDLPVTEKTMNELNCLVEKFDTSIDWESPASASPWTKEELQSFNSDVQNTLSTANSPFKNYPPLRTPRI